MLCQEFSHYVDLGLWYLKLLLCLSFPLIAYVIRKKWECAVAKEVEIRRLMALAAAETAKVEEEAAEAGYYAAGNVSRAALGFKGEVQMEEGSFGCCQYQATSHTEVAVENLTGAASGLKGEAKVEEGSFVCCHQAAAYAEVGLSNAEGHKCAVCLSPTTARCSRCKSVWYCSTKCQIVHWREGHQDICYPPCSMLTHSSNKWSYQRPKTFNRKKKVTLSEPVETKNNLLNPASPCPIGPTEQLNEKNDGNKAKILEEFKPSISAASFSTAFSSNSSYSSTTSYSSDDTSTTETNSSSDLEKSKVCPRGVIETSNLTKSTAGPSTETKSCDPNGSIIPPSKVKTRLISTKKDSQKTSNISSLNAGSCDPVVARSGQSDFWEGALDYGCSGFDKAKIRATNDYMPNIGSSWSGASGLYGKIDKSCHVSEKTYGSYSMINEPSKESVPSNKSDCYSPEVRISVPPNPNILKQEKVVDNSVLNISEGHKSKQCQGEAQRVSVSPLPSTKIADRNISFTNPISNSKCSSATNEDGTVHCFKWDNSSQHFDVSHSHRAQAGPVLNSSECTKQSMKSNLVGSLQSSSHGTHSCIDNRAKNASRVTNVDGVKSNSNVATSDKSYSRGDHFLASKLSRHCGADERGVKKDLELQGVFSYELFRSLYGWNKIELQPCGLVNCGNSCYANAVLQCLAFTTPLTAYFLQGLHTKSCPKKDWCFTCEFENLILMVKEGKSPISPVGIISHIQNIGSHLCNGREEDAHEFLRCVVETMQSISLKEAIGKVSGGVEEESTLLSLTFGGYLQSKIRCLKCGNKSERSERIMDLSVEIEGSIRSLEDALKRFTSSETLDGENKYNCDRCKSYQKARKKLTILEAPNILTIALKRFQAGTNGKLSKWIDFPQILNLAPYMSGSSDDKSPVYDLYGVIVHLDTMNSTFSGHYVCYVKNAQKKWFKIDDSVVKVSDFGKVKKQSAYMLLYARCLPRAPRHLRDKLNSISKLKTNPYSSRCSLVTPETNSPNFDSENSVSTGIISARGSNTSDDITWNSSSSSDSSSPSSSPS